MKDFILTRLWPLIAGLLLAFVVMTLLEYANSFIYPLPEGLDISDPQAVRVFTATLPWTAYVLVLAGWILGAFIAGLLTTYLSGEQKYRLSFLVGIILTLLGIINNVLIGHSMFFNMVGLPMFIIFTYLGHRYMRRMHAAQYEPSGI